VGPLTRRRKAIDQTRSGGRTNRGTGKSMGVEKAALGQFVLMRRSCKLIPITAQCRTHIFRRDPENVWPFNTVTELPQKQTVAKGD